MWVLGAVINIDIRNFSKWAKKMKLTHRYW